MLRKTNMKLFVYGTLRSDSVMNSVLNTKQDKKRTHVILQGYRKEGLNILSDEGSTVEGL